MAAQHGRSRLGTRYAALTARAKAGGSLVPDTSYADFLRNLEKQSPPHTVPFSSPPHHSSPGDGRKAQRKRPVSANAVRERAQQSLEQTSKQLKTIDEHMWQHKQEERSLRRAEMDVLKYRKTLERTMKKYDEQLSQQQREEVEAIAKKGEEFTAYKHKTLHDRQAGAKERTKLGLVGRQKVNTQTKKFMKQEQELSWRYQNLLNNLEMKKNEMEKLSKDFEKSIRNKEEEQQELKKDLAKLAITLNIEAGKRRQVMADDKRQMDLSAARERKSAVQQSERLQLEQVTTEVAGRRHESRRWSQEQSVQEKQDILHTQHREGGRKLMDIRSKQEQSLEQQRLTTKEAEHLHLDMMGRKIETRVQEVEAKRMTRTNELQRQTQARNRREGEKWMRRRAEMEGEARRRKHAERLSQLSHTVSSYESQERALYSQAREASGQRKRRSQMVNKLQEELEHLQKRNNIKLKEAALQAHRAEAALRQKLSRETTELGSASVAHADATQSLIAHRQRTKEEKRMLTEEAMEHERLSRIATKTATAQAP